MRIGIGYDLHRLVKGRPLIIGGVTIPFAKGLDGHSDADVLIHAIVDALLGAMGEDDIGKHFPVGDKRYKGISSMVLLKEISMFIKKKQFVIENIDCNIIAQEPKMRPYSDMMKKEIAKVLRIDKKRINIKAKTEEGLGYIGTGKAIAANAVALIK